MSTTPAVPAVPARALHPPVLDWYAAHARDLPWRHPDRSPWGVLVSEVMLQQTPVARVVPIWREWLSRWPEPAELAAEPVGAAVRAWGRLGYPRRAVRLHAAAVAITEQHAGSVPSEIIELRALPGVGEYTAAAVHAFAFGGRAVVVDTNVRRVLARALSGVALPPPSPTRSDLRLAETALPSPPDEAARWSAAVMELGALLCTARSPRCAPCPLRERCRWLLRGRPAYRGKPRRGQPWEGTDRQCRGVLLQVARASDEPVGLTAMRGAWPEGTQLDRCLDSLVADGLVQSLGGQRYGLPG